jgi:hypothetical protein
MLLNVTQCNNIVGMIRIGNVCGKTGVDVIVAKIGTEPLLDTREVSPMRKVLAVAVLGASLALASSAAFADERGVVEPVSQPTQQATVSVYSGSNLGTFAGGPVHEVSVDARRGMEGSSR